MSTDSLLPEENLSQGLNQRPTSKEEIIAKWKDKPREELEAAKAESDLYINTLLARLDDFKDLRNDYLQLKDQQQTGVQLKELLDRMDNPSRQPQEQHQNVQEQPTGIKPEDVEALIAKKISDRELSLKQQDNFTAMQAKLKQTYGEDYSSTYKQRLDTLGLTKEFADELARNHPTVFTKTFGLDEPQRLNSQSLPRSNVRPSSFAPSAQKRDWNYYQELKKTNPRMYLDPKIAVQMHNDAIELGAAFGMPED